MTASYTYTSQFLRKSHRKRLFQLWWLIALAILLMCPIVISDLRAGEISNHSIFALTALFICVLRYAYSWYRSCKTINTWVAQQGGKPVIYEFTQESLKSTLVVGESTLIWSVFQKMKITPLNVSLELPKGQGIWFMPREQMTAEEINFISERIREQGKPVIQ